MMCPKTRYPSLPTSSIAVVGMETFMRPETSTIKKMTHGVLAALTWILIASVHAQSVPTAPLWGALEYNNNNCYPCDTRLRTDWANQLALCQDYDQWEKQHELWALVCAQENCYVQDPQTDPRACHWVLHNDPNQLAGTGVAFYCGLWGDNSTQGPTWDAAKGVYICQVPDDNKNPGPPCCNGQGNPIHVGWGNKYQEETDYLNGGAGGLRFVRAYNSKGTLQASAIGARWRTNFDRALSGKIGIGIASVYAFRPDGKTLYFTLMKNGAYVPLTPYDSVAAWQSDSDIADKLTRVVDGSGNTLSWNYYVSSSEETETYDASGRLLAITSRSGFTQTLTYDGQSRLAAVSDPFGRQMTFSYDGANRIAAMTDPRGGIYQYSYDSVGNLSAVAYPDLSVRTYVYNEAAYTQNTSLPNALTGIVDELNARYATFNFNAQGAAISTEHAGGVEKYTVTYAGSTSTVVDPLGNSRTFGFSTLLGAVRNTGISQPCGTCGGENFSTITYDANSNVSSRIDFNNKKVCYAYDLSRNLETARLEGALSSETCSTALASPPNRPDVRKITTTWNATYRLPATIIDPAPGGSRTTTFTYDASGNLTQRSTTAPANDGSGNTVTRTWNWTYTTLGRVLTATDPDNHPTTTTYYADNDADLGKRGNVATITNAAGHVTQITAYDPNGRPLSITDPNGLVTTLTYHPRGWLTSRQLGAELTSYTYDGVGQLTKVTLPDGSYLQYTYDAAHRLTQINDSLNNKIVYTVDAMGNRIQETAYDPTNTLSRTRQQVYDSLNRLHQSVGAQ